MTIFPLHRSAAPAAGSRDVAFGAATPRGHPPAWSLDRIVRRFVPSVAMLTRSSAFRALVDGADLPFGWWYPEFRRLPPNHLRVKLGVGNRVFNNHLEYFTPRSAEFWLAMALEGLWSLDSTILEIGCGCGRVASVLRDFQQYEQRFRGRYYGVDVDEEMLAWCRRHFDAERFTFQRSTHPNEVYVDGAAPRRPYRVDLPDASIDLVYSHSLFSHLLEDELRNYVEEAYRLLADDRAMNMSFFSLDHPPPTYGSRHTFRHRIGNAMVESLRIPEAAVAYRDDFLIGLAEEVGFRRTEIRHSPDTWQPSLVCWK